MPISIVVGGQFGSEGKGKVVLEKVRQHQKSAKIVVRVGGTNSGHTAYDRQGRRWALRQMPAGCLDRDVTVVFPPGSYIDPQILLTEIEELRFPKDRIFISRYARIITDEAKAWERAGNLCDSIGSTGSGVGGAVMASVARGSKNFKLAALEAQDWEPLSRFLSDTTDLLTKRLRSDARVIIEGSQGFGLSLLDGGYWPKATSRSTTAAAALAEAGMSPMDVDEVILVLRTFPIRVAGHSGPLRDETSWEKVAKIAGRTDDISEYSTATKRLRRVGRFDADLVRRAISANNPTQIVLNHLDYIDDRNMHSEPQSIGQKFVNDIERKIGRSINYVGFSGKDLTPHNNHRVTHA